MQTKWRKLLVRPEWALVVAVAASGLIVWSVQGDMEKSSSPSTVAPEVHPVTVRVPPPPVTEITVVTKEVESPVRAR